MSWNSLRTSGILGSAALAAALALSCRPETFSEETQERAEDINQTLSINLPYVSQTDGLPEERQIDIVDLFFIPLDADGSEQYGQGTVNLNFAGSAARKTQNGLEHTVPASIAPGRYHVYVAANLTAAQRSHIMQNGPSAAYRAENATLEETDFSNTISDFAHYRDFRPGDLIDENSELANIVMFGTGLTEEGGRVFQITGNTDGAPTVPVICQDLQRVVAKIHLTVQPQTGNAVYIPLSGSLLLPDGSEKGWVRISDLRYTANCANKKILFQPYAAEDGGMADPNYLASECIRYSGAQYSIDADYARENFAKYSIESLREKRHQGLRPAEAYDAARVPGPNSVDEYTKGQYCLENTFCYDYNTIGAFFSPEEEQVYPLYFTTHLLVASMFTPRYLVATAQEIDAYNTTSEASLIRYREEGGMIASSQTSSKGWEPMDEVEGLKLLSFADEQQARSFMTFCLDYRGQLDEGQDFSTCTTLEPGGTYDARTFFVFRPEGSFYSIGAAYALLEHYQDGTTPEGYYLRGESFTAFNQGWCYYHTYIDGQGQHAGEADIAFTESMVSRNHYYILRLNSISTLGSVRTPVFMQTYTVCEDWDDTGGEGTGIAE